MFERFNHDARRLLVLAQEQAGDLGHGWTGTEHLLLALAAQPSGTAGEVLAEAGVDLATVRGDVIARLGSSGTAGHSGSALHEDEVALRSIGIDLDAVRARIETVFGPGALECAPRSRRRRVRLRRRGRECHDAAARGTQRLLAPRAKKSLELALREAIALGHGWIGPEHVLLGMLRVPDCMGAEILVARGIRLKDLRQRVLDRLRQLP
jgi:ATP-dependent Clp protease ATP-binding subunit ClpA